MFLYLKNVFPAFAQQGSGSDTGLYLLYLSGPQPALLA